MVPRPLRWTEEQLRDAVESSRTLAQVCRRLGVSAGGDTYRSLRQHIQRLGIAADHLPPFVEGRVRGVRAWTDDDLVEAVRCSRSFSQVQRMLGYKASGGMHRYISAHMRRLGLDSSHFTGQSWARGLTGVGGRRARPLADILVVNSTYPSGPLRRRLIREGLKEPCCEICGLSTWRGEPLPLALDHINGDPCDNRLENLRVLCPNCHALTDTWCGRNIRAPRQKISTPKADRLVGPTGFEPALSRF
ncbi:MAG: hypothetical protein QOI15_2458 [Pseudonocardiales bacterium]|nr:hypothetical protein [Pseudonocardiales bacterium]